MALYECVYIARQDISTSQVEGLTEQFTTLISENGGTVAKTEYWGLRNLAYKVKKNRKGYYVLLNLDAPHAAVNELKRVMGLNEDVLRTLVLRVDALEDGPSIVMQNRNDRDSRGGRSGDRGGDRRPREGSR